jgi:hypothetical protein
MTLPKKCIATLLVEAMKNLDMIETQGGGIRKILTFKTTIFPHFQIITLMIIR